MRSTLRFSDKTLDYDYNRLASRQTWDETNVTFNTCSTIVTRYVTPVAKACGILCRTIANYLNLKHCDRIIQHLHTNSKHFTSFSRCCRRSSTTSIHTSRSRVTMRHLGSSAAFHTYALYIVHLQSSTINRRMTIYIIYFLVEGLIYNSMLHCHLEQSIKHI